MVGGLAVLLTGATLGEGGARPDVELVVYGGIVALLGVVLVTRSRSGEAAPRLDASAPAGAFGLFGALVLAGAVASPYAWAALEVVIVVALFAAVAALAGRCGSGLPATLSPILLAAGALQGAIAVFQRLAEGQARPAGTFLNPNHLGAWLVAVLLVGLGAPARPSRAAVVVRFVLALPAAVGLALTGSRGAFIAFLAGGSWLLLTRWGNRRHRIVVATTMAVLAVALAVGLFARSTSFDPFRYNRVRIWKASWAAASAHPWTGTGPGQFRSAAPNLNFPVEDEVLRYERHFKAPHSDLLRLPIEFGFPATAAFLAAVTLALREIFRRRREVGPGSDAAMAALIALGIQGVVDDLSDRPALWLLAGTLAGALLSRSVATPVRFRRPTRAVLAVVLVLGFIVGPLADYLAWGVRMAAVEMRGEEVRGESDVSANTLTSSVLIGEAIRLNPLRAETWLTESDLFVDDEAVWTLARYAAAREAAETAIRLQPGEARNWLGLARVEARGCLELFGDEASRERFDRHYIEAERLARHDVFIAVERGEMLLAASDPAGARRAAERALAIEPRAALPRLLLAEALLATGEPGDVERAVALADETEDLARGYAGRPMETPYAQRLLTVDPHRLEAIRVRTRAADEVRSSPGPDSGRGGSDPP
jgi:O-antigen ligase